MEAEPAGSGAPTAELESASRGPDPPSQPLRQQAEAKAKGSPQPALDPPPASPATIKATTSETAKAAEGDAGGGLGGGAPCSFSQLLAGMGSAAVPVLAVPVDATWLSVVAVPCFIAPAGLDSRRCERRATAAGRRKEEDGWRGRAATTIGRRKEEGRRGRGAAAAASAAREEGVGRGGRRHGRGQQ